MTPARQVTWTALALLALAATPRADEERGIVLTRQAQAALAAGDAESALALLQQARTEWPNSALVANTLGDVHRALDQFPEAAAEYARGMREECEYHAKFNHGVTLHDQAERKLGEAGVPLDPAGLPEGPQPAMLDAIGSQSLVLEAARDDFLKALDLHDDASGRESLGALNRRLDDLRAMRDELKQREQENQQKQDDKDQDKDKQNQDKQDKDKQDKDKQDQQQPPDQKDQPQDQKDQQDQQDQQDQKDGKDDAQDQKDQQDQQDQKDDADQQGEDQPQDGNPQTAPARELSKEEAQQLLDKLDQLEKQGRELQKARLAAERRAVEKDW